MKIVPLWFSLTSGPEKVISFRDNVNQIVDFFPCSLKMVIGVAVKTEWIDKNDKGWFSALSSAFHKILLKTPQQLDYKNCKIFIHI